jgi:CheY-like chemotaxis protein
MANKKIEKMLQGLNIPMVDDNPYMRRLTRMMLTNLGAKSVLEAPDGLAALEAIRTVDPGVMLLDWDICPCSMASRCFASVVRRACSRARICRSLCSPRVRNAVR